MERKLFVALINRLATREIDVRIDVEEPHASSDPEVASRLAHERAERIRRGERVAYVYANADADEDDYKQAYSVTADEVKGLVESGARLLSARDQREHPTRFEMFLGHMMLVGKTVDFAPVCPVCKVAAWDVGELVTAPRFDGEKGSFFATGFPLLQVTCTNCFYAMHFAWKPIEERVNSPAGKQAIDAIRQLTQRRRDPEGSGG
jgi:hypothetical protein